MTRQLSIFTLLLWLITSTAHAQQAASPAAQPSTGAITGRVVNTEGQPLPGAKVSVNAVGARQNYSVRTNDEGYFRVPGLPSGNYSVSATAEGYLSPTANPSPRGTGDDRYYHPGATVTFTFKKGAAITGKVINAKGEPVIGVVVSATVARTASSGVITISIPSAERITDDRGIYRLWGLSPGSYIIAAQGRGQRFGYFSSYDGNVPIYYPSSTRQEATEIKVREGEEVSDIDISYRSEPGRSVSGSLTGAVGSSQYLNQSTITLNYASTGIALAYAGDGSAHNFAFYGVPDGEYEMQARRSVIPNDEGAVSLPLRVTVKGEDVTGLNLKLTPFGAIAGRAALDPASAANLPASCQPSDQASLSNVSLITFLSPAWQSPESFRPASAPGGRPNDQGVFQISRLEAGNYRFTVRVPNNWYVRAITRPAASAARQPVDVTFTGLPLNPGERIEDLTVTLAAGAASFGGQVVAATDGMPLPARLEVHFVPAERGQENNLLRFAQALVGNNGKFSIGNLAPGRYWLLTRVLPEGASASLPLAWDTAERAKLRREAADANVMIELQPCQRVSDYVLRYAASSSK